jgi:hypothetical protein
LVEKVDQRDDHHADTEENQTRAPFHDGWNTGPTADGSSSRTTYR